MPRAVRRSPLGTAQLSSSHPAAAPLRAAVPSRGVRPDWAALALPVAPGWLGAPGMLQHVPPGWAMTNTSATSSHPKGAIKPPRSQSISCKRRSAGGKPRISSSLQVCSALSSQVRITWCTEPCTAGTGQEAQDPRSYLPLTSFHHALCAQEAPAPFPIPHAAASPDPALGQQSSPCAVAAVRTTGCNQSKGSCPVIQWTDALLQ